MKAALLATLVVLAACNTAATATPSPSPSPTPSPSPSPTAAPASLDGRTFVSTSVTRGGADFPLVNNTQLRLTFDPPVLHGTAGCNSMSGNYLIAGNVLHVDQLAMTEMACDPPALMDQETWFAQLLGSQPTLALDGNNLTITSADTVVTMVDREIAEPDAKLVGPVWTVDTIISGEAASSVPQGVIASLQFDENGGLTLNTGCNDGGGKYTVDGGTITFSDLVTTEKACAGAAGQLEQAVVAVLSAGTVDYSIDANRLTLTAGAAGLGLTAR